MEREERGPGFLKIPGTDMPKPPPQPWTADDYARFRSKQAQARLNAWLFSQAVRDGRVKFEFLIQGLQWSPIA